MAKVFNYVILLSGLLLLLAFAGLPTATNALLGAFGIAQTTSDSGQVQDINLPFWAAAAAVVAIGLIFLTSAGTGGTVQIGTFVINSTDSKLVASFTTLLAGWVAIDLISIFNYAQSLGQSWITFLTALIIFPMLIAFAIAIVQFWRGNDIA